ncbi:MAG: ATP-binding cassette domain-containing protein [Candidatus Hodarchaeota archaeon]
MEHVVEAKDLTKIFERTIAVDHISFSVKSGEVFSLLGPNGAGKTTTVRMLCGLLKPTEGSATVGGHDIIHDTKKVRQIVGFLPEVHGLYERLSAYENLDFYGQLYGLSNHERHAKIRELLELVGLWERRNEKTGTFSRGMKQKIAIARSLIHDPEILFLDEPTSGLDPTMSKKVRDFITELCRKQSRTAFICTHRLAEAEQLSTRVVIINRGRTVAVGKTEIMRKRLWKYRRFKISLVGLAKPILKILKGIPAISNIETENSCIFFEVENPVETNPIIVSEVVKAGGQIIAFEEVRRSLEEIYLKIMGEL